MLSGEQDMTLGQVLGMFKASIASRHEAADLLERVAEYGRAGCFPADVACEQLGRALFRIVMNAQEEDPFIGILNGWRAAEREFNERLR
jgi:hypothetical protein